MFNPSQPGHNGGVISLAPVDAAHPVNQARWVKFLILLYRYDFWSGHCLDNDYTFSVASLNPATTTTASFDDFLPWLYLGSALFSGIYLTRGGTVLYLGQLHNHLLVDEEGLRTGRLAIVDYDINDTVKDLVLRRPFTCTSRIRTSFTMVNRYPTCPRVLEVEISIINRECASSP
jgi:hypothetical protein